SGRFDLLELEFTDAPVDSFRFQLWVFLGYLGLKLLQFQLLVHEDFGDDREIQLQVPGQLLVQLDLGVLVQFLLALHQGLVRIEVHLGIEHLQFGGLSYVEPVLGQLYALPGNDQGAVQGLQLLVLLDQIVISDHHRPHRGENGLFQFRFPQFGGLLQLLVVGKHAKAIEDGPFQVYPIVEVTVLHIVLFQKSAVGTGLGEVLDTVVIDQVGPQPGKHARISGGGPQFIDLQVILGRFDLVIVFKGNLDSLLYREDFLGSSHQYASRDNDQAA